eukprot:gene6575-9040_t
MKSKAAVDKKAVIPLYSKFSDDDSAALASRVSNSIVVKPSGKSDFQKRKSFSFFNNISIINTFASKSVDADFEFSDFQFDKVTPKILWEEPESIMYGELLSEKELNAECVTEYGVFEYIPPMGTVLSAGVHELRVIFTPTEPSNARVVEKIVKIEVKKILPDIHWHDPLAIVFGESLTSNHLNAKCSNAIGNFSYSPDLDTKLEAGENLLTVAFVPHDPANCVEAKKSVRILVNKSDPHLVWMLPPDPLEEGEPLTEKQLNAECVDDPAIRGKFHYTPAFGHSFEAVGDYELEAEFIPDDTYNYHHAKITTTIHIKSAFKRTLPCLQWPSPPVLIFGCPLSEEHLNAIALIPNDLIEDKSNNNVDNGIIIIEHDVINLEGTTDFRVQGASKDSSIIPGSYDYNPSLGTILDAGVYDLFVAFTPLDEVNFAPAEATVSITVKRYRPNLAWIYQPLVPEEIADHAVGEMIVDRSGIYFKELGEYKLTAACKENLSGMFSFKQTNAFAFPEADSYEFTAHFEVDESLRLNYLNSSISTSILVVGKMVPSIEWGSPLPLIFRYPLTSLELNARCINYPLVEGSFTYLPAIDTILEAGVHTLGLVFTPLNKIKYVPAKISVELEILKYTPHLDWNINENHIFYTEEPLTEKELCALCLETLDDDIFRISGQIVYDPPIGFVASSPGQIILSATFIPSEEYQKNYNSSSMTIICPVNDKIVPYCVWETPSSIIYGILLDDSQLNATVYEADIDTPLLGRFTYEPSFATRLDTGSHELKMRFDPDDTVRYRPISYMVTIEVIPYTPSIKWHLENSSGNEVVVYVEENLTQSHLLATIILLDETLALPSGDIIYSPPHGYKYDQPETSLALAIVMIIAIRSTSRRRIINNNVITYGDYLIKIPVFLTVSTGTYELESRFITSPEFKRNFTEVISCISIVVIPKIVPVIEWNTPETISYSTPLSSDQLNAMCVNEDPVIEGMLVYYPPLDTVLLTGKHELRVTFTPSDTIKYAVVDYAVAIMVEKQQTHLIWPFPHLFYVGQIIEESYFFAKCNVEEIEGKIEYSLSAGWECNKAGNYDIAAYFTPLGVFFSENYTACALTIPFHVSDKIDPVVMWKMPHSIDFKTLLSHDQYNAKFYDDTDESGTTTVEGKVECIPPLGTLLHAGDHGLRTIFYPSNTIKYNSVEKDVYLTVYKAVPDISWCAPSDPLDVRDELSDEQLNATCLDGINGEFVYNPPHKHVFDHPGTYEMTVKFIPDEAAEWDYSHGQKTISVTVLHKQTPNLEWNNPDDIEYGTVLSEVQLNAICIDEGVLGSFKYSPSINYLLNAGKQQLTVKFIPKDGLTYRSIKKSVTIIVHKKRSTLVWDWDTDNLREQFYISQPISNKLFNACLKELDVPGVIQYLIDGYEVGRCSVNESIDHSNSEEESHDIAVAERSIDKIHYVFEKAKTYKISAVFLPADSIAHNYASSSRIQTLDVLYRSTPHIQWDEPSSIEYGTELSSSHFSATVRDEIEGLFRYDHSVGDVLGVGNHALKVVFLPDKEHMKKYLTAEKIVTISVMQIVPKIIWNQPKAIYYGVTLDSIAVLNATNRLRNGDSLLGNFRYDPPLGTKLCAGQHVLTTTFYPHDMTNYAVVTASVSLTVIKATPTIEWNVLSVDPLDVIEPVPGDIANAVCAESEATGQFMYDPMPGHVIPSVGVYSFSVTYVPSEEASLNFTECTKTVRVTVAEKIPPIVQWYRPEPITYRTPLSEDQLNAFVVTNDLKQLPMIGRFVYDPPLGSVLPAGSEELHVTFIPNNYNLHRKVRKSISLQIMKKTPTIHWPKFRTPLLVGERLSSSHLSAMCTDEGVTGQITFSPPIGYAFRSPGFYDMAAMFVPDSIGGDGHAGASINNNFTRATMTISVEVVLRIAPTIRWSKPDKIALGTALSADQLNAECEDPDGEVSGPLVPYPLGEEDNNEQSNFWCVYSPPLGTVLNGGQQDLFVLLVPRNLNKYCSVLHSVRVTVSKLIPTVRWEQVSDLNLFIGDTLPSRQFNAVCEDEVNGTITGSFFYYYQKTKKGKRIIPLRGFEFRKKKEYKVYVRYTPSPEYINYDSGVVQMIVNVRDRVTDSLYPTPEERVPETASQKAERLKPRRMLSYSASDVTGYFPGYVQTRRMSPSPTDRAAAASSPKAVAGVKGTSSVPGGISIMAENEVDDDAYKSAMPGMTLQSTKLTSSKKMVKDTRRITIPATTGLSDNKWKIYVGIIIVATLSMVHQLVLPLVNHSCLWENRPAF